VYFTPNVLASGSSGPFTWFGTLAENGAGSTGLLYRRNRYFDPVSGRFTQADPIGLAGGLNLYGFANGDPVNFADPFGLCPEEVGVREAIACALIEGTTGVLGAAAGFIAGGGGGALASVPTGGLAAPVTIPAGAVAGAATGGIAGKLTGEAITNVLFAGRASGAGRMQREVERGQAPRQVRRVDKGNPSDPGDLEPHVHLRDGSALTQGGRWKHGGDGGVPKTVADWLRNHGWRVPE
jgi:RHS repeat-associated protein